MSTSKMSPYLFFNGNCEEAIEFYRSIFGSEILFLERFENAPMETPPEWKQKILHCSMEVHGMMLMASDGMPGKPYASGNNFALNVSFDSIPMMEARFKRLSEGGEVTMPLENAFWGERFGMLVDRFGVRWMFSHKLSK